MYAFIISFIVLGIILIAVGGDEEPAYRIIGVIILFSSSGTLGAALTAEAIISERAAITNQTFKVRELEQNTVFTIKDSTNLLQPNDSVWVNMTTRRVDPVDSVAMKCVVLERVKHE